MLPVFRASQERQTELKDFYIEAHLNPAQNELPCPRNPFILLHIDPTHHPFHSIWTKSTCTTDGFQGGILVSIPTMCIIPDWTYHSEMHIYRTVQGGMERVSVGRKMERSSSNRQRTRTLRIITTSNLNPKSTSKSNPIIDTHRQLQHHPSIPLRNAIHPVHHPPLLLPHYAHPTLPT